MTEVIWVGYYVIYNQLVKYLVDIMVVCEGLSIIVVIKFNKVYGLVDLIICGYKWWGLNVLSIMFDIYYLRCLLKVLYTL